MKFRDFITEEKEKTTVLAFGRMNPGPTIGHEKLINTVKSLAKDHKADHLVVMSHSQDPKKNPLSPEQKLKHAKRFFPKINFKTSSKQSPSFLSHAAELHKSGTKHLIMVGGSDRVDEYHKTLHKYNGEGEGKLFNFKSIKVVSSGERDPDAEGAEGMSASKMRAHAAANNFKEFRKGVPSHVSDVHAKELFHDTQQGMKSAPKSVREQYINGEIFNVGDTVYFEESVGTITGCGKNFVTVESIDGTNKKWISDISTEKPLLSVEIDEDITEQKIRTIPFKQTVEKELPRLLMTKKQIEEYNQKLEQRSGVITDSTIEEDLRDPKDNPCWKGYKPVGVKKKNGKTVPNCVPANEEKDDYDPEDLEWEDIEDTYEDDDLMYEEILDEKISAASRLRKRMSFARTSRKRQTAAAIKLKRPSTQAQLQKRATVAARRMLLKRILQGRDKSGLSAQEKDMIEQRLKQMSKIQSTLAVRLIPKIKDLERKRLKTK